MSSGQSDTASLPSKLQYRAIKAGERLVCLGAGGGGFGDPRMRDPQLVLRDVRDGLITADLARETYAVAIKDGKVDETATLSLRA